MKTILVGIAPARKGEEGQPLSALASQSTGRKIADLLGIAPVEYMKSFDRVNVCPFPRPSTIKPTEWTAAAENLAGSLLRGRRVILLGPNVAACFGITRLNFDFLSWREAQPSRVTNCLGYVAGRSAPFSWAVLPHPSGRNRWYNDEKNRRAAREFLQFEIK